MRNARGYRGSAKMGVVTPLSNTEVIFRRLCQNIRSPGEVKVSRIDLVLVNLP